MESRFFVVKYLFFCFGYYVLIKFKGVMNMLLNTDVNDKNNSP